MVLIFLTHLYLVFHLSTFPIFCLFPEQYDFRMYDQKAVNKTSLETYIFLPHTVQGSKFQNFTPSFLALFTKGLEKAHAKLPVKKMPFRCTYTNLKVNRTRWVIRYDSVTMYVQSTEICVLVYS